MLRGLTQAPLIASAILLSQLPAAASAQDQLIVQRLLADPGEQQHVLAAAKRSAVVADNPCPSARFSLTGPVVVFVRPEFDSAGDIAKGSWKQTVEEQGCGAKRVLNVLAVVRAPKTLATMPILPGTTRAGPQLQKAGVQFAAEAATTAGVRARGCTGGYMADTRYLRQDGAPVDGAKDPPWSELWTLVMCERKAEVPMRFIPERAGTRIVAEPARVTPIKSPR